MLSEDRSEFTALLLPDCMSSAMLRRVFSSRPSPAGWPETVWPVPSTDCRFAFTASVVFGPIVRVTWPVLPP